MVGSLVTLECDRWVVKYPTLYVYDPPDDFMGKCFEIDITRQDAHRFWLENTFSAYYWGQSDIVHFNRQTFEKESDIWD